MKERRTRQLDGDLSAVGGRRSSPARQPVGKRKVAFMPNSEGLNVGPSDGWQLSVSMNGCQGSCLCGYRRSFLYITPMRVQKTA